MHKLIQRISAILLTMALILSVPFSTVAATTRKQAETATVSVAGTTLAVKSDNSLWAWGFNMYGTVGDGTTTRRNSPMKIMDGVASVSSGGLVSTAVKTDGTLWVWGNNAFGAIGTSNAKVGGRDAIQTKPVKRMDNVVAAAAGNSYWLALRNDGTLWSAGDNKYGQLGDGTKTHRAKPVKVMSNVISIAAGGIGTSFAIKSDGSLWGWGFNSNGALGDSTQDDRSKPVKIIDNVKSVATSASVTYAIKNDGTLWAWGYGYDGALGNGSREGSFVPIKIMDNVNSVAAGGQFALAVKEDGTLYYWGSNYRGEFGNGKVMKDESVPILKPTKSKLTDVIAVFAGTNTSYFMRSDGSLWGCGSDVGNGGKGNAVESNWNTPIQTIPAKALDSVKKP